MNTDPRLIRRFQEEVAQLVDQYLLDGLPPMDIVTVLQTEATNDLPGRLHELRDYIAATKQAAVTTGDRT